MPPHSMASRATPTAIITRKGQPPNQAAASAPGTRMVAEAMRRPRLDQSNFLAGGKDVIWNDCAVPTVAGGELRDGGSQVLGAVVGPEDVLEYQLGVRGLPQQEVRQPLLAGRTD